MGVDLKAIVKNEKELRERAMYIINTYQQPALVETFLPGREFTVGVMGRPDAKLYSRNPDWYEKDGFHRFPVLELDSSRSVTPNVYSQASKSKSVGEKGAPGYICPAILEPELEKKLNTSHCAHINCCTPSTFLVRIFVLTLKETRDCLKSTPYPVLLLAIVTYVYRPNPKVSATRI